MTADELRAWAKAHAPQMPQAAAMLRLLDGFDHIGVGDFRAGWLAEAERIWAARDVESPGAEVLVWVARVRELVRAMANAHHEAGLKTQFEQDGGVLA